MHVRRGRRLVRVDTARGHPRATRSNTDAHAGGRSGLYGVVAVAVIWGGHWQLVARIETQLRLRDGWMAEVEAVRSNELLDQVR